jgi:hypothetical protein
MSVAPRYQFNASRLLVDFGTAATFSSQSCKVSHNLHALALIHNDLPPLLTLLETILLSLQILLKLLRLRRNPDEVFALQLPTTFLVHKRNVHSRRDHVSDLPAVEAVLLALLLDPLHEVFVILHELLTLELFEEGLIDGVLLVRVEFVVFDCNVLGC